jgi:hypothetical protein
MDTPSIWLEEESSEALDFLVTHILETVDKDTEIARCARLLADEIASQA